MGAGSSSDAKRDKVAALGALLHTSSKGAKGADEVDEEGEMSFLFPPKFSSTFFASFSTLLFNCNSKSRTCSYHLKERHTCLFMYGVGSLTLRLGGIRIFLCF